MYYKTFYNSKLLSIVLCSWLCLSSLIFSVKSSSLLFKWSPVMSGISGRLHELYNMDMYYKTFIDSYLLCILSCSYHSLLSLIFTGKAKIHFYSWKLGPGLVLLTKVCPTPKLKQSFYVCILISGIIARRAFNFK